MKRKYWTRSIQRDASFGRREESNWFETSVMTFWHLLLLLGPPFHTRFDVPPASLSLTTQRPVLWTIDGNPQTDPRAKFTSQTKSSNGTRCDSPTGHHHTLFLGSLGSWQLHSRWFGDGFQRRKKRLPLWLLDNRFDIDTAEFSTRCGFLE